MEPSLPLSPPSPIFQENQLPASIISRSRNSESPPARLDQSDGREPIFPDTKRQLETILRNASEGWENGSEPAGTEPQVIMDRSKLIILEDRFTVMQKRNVVLITENESLRSQAKKLSDKIRKLEERWSKNSSVNSLETTKNEDAIEPKKMKQRFEDRGVATIDFPDRTVERGIQVSAIEVCRLCQRMFQQPELLEPTVVVTKSELDALKEDMRRLKEAVTSRELDLERAIERENSYRVQLKRLAAETITARQLSDSRHAELERLAQSLTESEKELKLAQKEISTLKKNARQDKRQRELGEGKSANDGIGHKGDMAGSTGMIDNETRGIDDIAGQLTSGKNTRQRSMKSPRSTDRVMYSSGTIFSSDRTIDEPITIAEMLTKL